MAKLKAVRVAKDKTSACYRQQPRSHYGVLESGLSLPSTAFPRQQISPPVSENRSATPLAGATVISPATAECCHRPESPVHARIAARSERQPVAGRQVVRQTGLGSF